MIYSNETGYCEWIDYDRHQEIVSEKEEQIEHLERTIIDLEEELSQHKELIEELKEEVKTIEKEKDKENL